MYLIKGYNGPDVESSKVFYYISLKEMVFNKSNGVIPKGVLIYYINTFKWCSIYKLLVTLNEFAKRYEIIFNEIKSGWKARRKLIINLRFFIPFHQYT